MRHFALVCLICLVLLVSRPARAVDSSVQAGSEPDGEHMITLLWSPLYSAFSLHQFTVEARLGSKFGLAAIGGLGTVAYEGEKIDLKELGGRAQVYVVGDFDLGVQLGGQMLVFDASTSRSVADGSYSASGTAVSGGPFVGFKWASRIGATFDAQVGGQYLVGSGQGTAHSVLAARYGGPSSISSSQSARMWLPIVNANLGWSF